MSSTHAFPKLVAKRLSFLQDRLQGWGVGQMLWDALSAAEQTLLTSIAFRAKPEKTTDAKPTPVFLVFGGPLGIYAKLKRVSEIQAIIEVAEICQLISAHEAGKLKSLTDIEVDSPEANDHNEVNQSDANANKPCTPQWRRDAGELWFGDTLVRQVRLQVNSRIVMVLDAFEAAQWPSSIDDLLSNAGAARDVVRQLNKDARNKAITFHTASIGRDRCAVVWRAHTKSH